MMVNGFPDRTIQVQGKEHLYFGGTSYLGMATHRGFQQLIIESIKAWGTSYGSSRNANVRLSSYNKAEALFSQWLNIDSTVTVSSGALAGRIVIDYLAKSPATFYHYPKTHPAILAKNSLPLFQDGKLHPKLLDTQTEEVVITADAMRSLEVFATAFEFLENIPKHKAITLVIDESHTLGILGNQGRGIFHDIPVERIKRKIMISSLGKALGISGGIIASDNEFIDNIKKEPSFVSSSGANPAYLEAFTNAQELIVAQQKKLEANMKTLFALLDSKIISQQNVNYPVLYFIKDGFYEALLKKNIVITSFDYPSYKKPMNRIVITANHLEDDLIKLAKVLNDLF